MRIFIPGGLGQLGRALQTALRAHAVTAVDLPDFDITQRKQTEAEIAAGGYDLVINCAAYTNVDGCARDPALAQRVNGHGPHNLALACRQAGIPLLHVSTNEVFFGDQPDGYAEWMPLKPRNPYGVSKALGEFNVRAALPEHYIVRTAWLYAHGGRNFIHAILQRARESGRLRVVTDEIGNPTYAQDLAHAITQLIETRQFGTYHFVNAGSCSRWAFANEILRQAGLQDVTNEPILSREFERASNPPPFGALQNNTGAVLGIIFRPWQAALAEFLAGA